jgi:cleavage and polyadenylation specificity factor subunit 2
VFLFAGKGEGITITPYAAGHLLGGTVWKISVDTEDIIYAVDYNHRNER